MFLLISSRLVGAFEKTILLSNYPEKSAKKYLLWVKERTSSQFQIEPVKLRGPNDFEDIYRAATAIVAGLRAKHPRVALICHLSPGSPVMAAAWILLAKRAIQRADRVITRARCSHGSFPFELVAEFTPTGTTSADGEVEGLPPSAPGFEQIVYRSVTQPIEYPCEQVFACVAVPGHPSAATAEANGRTLYRMRIDELL